MRFAWFSSVLALFSTATAQTLDRIYVTDNVGDKLWSLADLNSDGDYNDAGEASVFYDDTLGPLALSSNVALKRLPDGSLLVTDNTLDQLLRFKDLDADGDAHDAGEVAVWFDAATNLSGVAMPSCLNLWVESNGTVWCANAGNTGSPADTILRMSDGNADGDANDVGEASVFYTAPTTSHLPQAVAQGPDGKIYYVEGIPAGPKSVWRLDDADSSGTIDQPGEATPFFIPPAQPNTSFFWALRFDAAGNFYLNDQGNGLWWKFRDTNGDDVVDPLTEAIVWWQSTTPSNSFPWDLVFAPDGSAYSCEGNDPDRILHLVDGDANGSIAPGETFEVYSELVSASAIGDVRGIEFGAAAVSGQAFCAGDGLDPNVTTACPCANSGGPGRGCAHSFDATGARLGATGQADPDSLVLRASELPATSFTLFMQHDAADDRVFHDGVLCASGTLVRLRGRGAVGGVASFPNTNFANDVTTSLSLRGGVVPGSGALRFYAAWYRNASTTFCPPATANVTNGWRLTW